MLEVREEPYRITISLPRSPFIRPLSGNVFQSSRHVAVMKKSSQVHFHFIDMLL
jgi:hypothetical protein